MHVVTHDSVEAVKQALHTADCGLDFGVVMQGLCVIHCSGLVHGDIKPDNLKIDMMVDGSLPHLVITDLGSALKNNSGQHRGNSTMSTFLSCPAPLPKYSYTEARLSGIVTCVALTVNCCSCRHVDCCCCWLS